MQPMPVRTEKCSAWMAPRRSTGPERWPMLIRADGLWPGRFHNLQVIRWATTTCLLLGLNPAAITALPCGTAAWAIAHRWAARFDGSIPSGTSRNPDGVGVAPSARATSRRDHPRAARTYVANGNERVPLVRREGRLGAVVIISGRTTRASGGDYSYLERTWLPRN